MGLVYSSVIDAPIYEVFDWHSRPGAFTRLSPPWQPGRIVAEADSLKDGRAELGFPGGLRWVADHQPDGYDPPRRFVDAISTDDVVLKGLAKQDPNVDVVGPDMSVVHDIAIPRDLANPHD